MIKQQKISMIIGAAIVKLIIEKRKEIAFCLNDIYSQRS